MNIAFFVFAIFGASSASRLKDATSCCCGGDRESDSSDSSETSHSIDPTEEQPLTRKTKVSPIVVQLRPVHTSLPVSPPPFELPSSEVSHDAFYPARLPKAEDSLRTTKRRANPENEHVSNRLISTFHQQQSDSDSRVRLPKAEDSMLTAQRRGWKEDEMLPLPPTEDSLIIAQRRGTAPIFKVQTETTSLEHSSPEASGLEY